MFKNPIYKMLLSHCTFKLSHPLGENKDQDSYHGQYISSVPLDLL